MGRKKFLTQREIKLFLKYPYLIPLYFAIGFIVFGELLGNKKYSNIGITLIALSLLSAVLYYYFLNKAAKKRIREEYYSEQRQIELEKKRIEKLGRTGLQYIDGLSGYDFEAFLHAKFLTLGYKVKHTNNSGDYGLDLIVEKNSKKIGIQAKRYSNNVPYKAIQEAYSGKRFYGCDEAWVITTAKDFTKQARNGALQLDIKLFNINDFAEFLENQSNISD